VRVLITGGTGFLGSHVAAAAIGSGHDVRLLVRRPERVGPTLAPLGVAVDDVVVGDVLDAVSVRQAMDGCDAVINAAAVFSLDPRNAREALATNVRATEIVLGAAADQGLDPIVHVSSYVALLPSRGILGPDAPVGSPGPPYARSKAESDTVARRFQSGGTPVVITYPGALAGPHDPYLGDTDFTIAMMLRNRVPFALTGGWAVADVGYVARAHAQLLERSRGQRRFMLGGHFATWRGLFAALRGVTGRRLPTVPTPAPVAVASGRAMDALQRVVRPRLPFGYQGPWIVTRCHGTDDARAREELGVEPPPLEKTLASTIRWLVEAGHLPAKYAGRLAQDSEAL
jgi:nucleoside-diphosphate-sugar epimerase